LIPFASGCVPPVLFLLYSQWAMYGDPFLPGQYWMPAVHFTERGFRGFSWPSLDLFLKNLLHPDWGLVAFSPVFLLLMLPAAWRRSTQPPALTTGETRFIAGSSLAFLLFCAANQYSRMQWNTGFRYLITIVPLLFLPVAAALARMPTRPLLWIGIPCVLHHWVLCMVRFTPVDWNDSRHAMTESWKRILTEGPQLPALEVAASSLPALSWVGSAWFSSGLLLAGLLVAAWISRPLLRSGATGLKV
jgi:hypothetical protein